MNTKSIWYISKYVAPPGIGKVGSRGFMIMRELVRMGHTCTIITSDSNTLVQPPTLAGSHLIQDLDGVTFCWVRTLKYSTAKSLRRIISWLHFEWRLLLLPLSDFTPPDAIVVSSLSLLTILNGFRLRRRYRCRLVFEIRDIWPLTLTEEGGFSPRNPLVKALALIERLGYRHADAIVGTMPNLSEHVTTVLGYQRKVHCVPMGIDPAMIDNIEPLTEEYIHAHIPDNKFIVAHVGSIGITNALDAFFECASRMTELSNIHFLLVGSGDLRDYYQKKYHHLNNLTFAPSVPHRKVQSVLKHCDLLYFSVYPSKVWRYGQSLNKVIDYMLSGKPILASYSGYHSMINEAGCGEFVPSEDIPALIEGIKQALNQKNNTCQSREGIGRAWLLNNRTYRKLASQYIEILSPQAPNDSSLHPD